MSVLVWIFWHPRVFVSLCRALITCSRHVVLRWWISVWLPGLSSNKEVSAEPILACAEHCFTHERVARETLYNQMVRWCPQLTGWWRWGWRCCILLVMFSLPWLCKEHWVIWNKLCQNITDIMATLKFKVAHIQSLIVFVSSIYNLFGGFLDVNSKFSVQSY